MAQNGKRGRQPMSDAERQEFINAHFAEYKTKVLVNSGVEAEFNNLSLETKYNRVKGFMARLQTKANKQAKEQAKENARIGETLQEKIASIDSLPTNELIKLQADLETINARIEKAIENNRAKDIAEVEKEIAEVQREAERKTAELTRKLEDLKKPF